MLKRLGIAGLFILIQLPVMAQDTGYARQCISKLCSKGFYGRGYTKNGAVKASGYIAGEMKKSGLLPLGEGYFQNFEFSVNTFSADPYLKIDGTVLRPGIDFQVSADAPASKFRTDPNSQQATILIDRTNIGDSAWRNSLPHPGMQSSNARKNASGIPIVYIIDTLPADLEKKHRDFLNDLKHRGNTIFLVRGKLTWSVATEQSAFISFDVLRTAVNIPKPGERPLLVQWKVKSALKNTKQRNVIGYIPGKLKPDSFILITAHYDHLGTMGKSSVFYGANDNAAGVAMVLDLARYYREHPPEYSMVFIAFAGEEPGLIGSLIYVKNPRHPLKNTRMVLNLDLVGTGETGMTVVNATVFTNEFALLDSINRREKYVTEIRKRGKAANSDHYFFSELGIPAFFWYQSGPRTSYHDIQDIPSTLTLAGYNGTFRLAVKWIQSMAK